jgi:nitrous oxidase accessory protein NosD
VAINPGESIQGRVNAAPAGTQFVLKAGVHRRQSVTPKDGMAFLGEPGAVLDGEGVTAYAIGTPAGGARNVTVRGLVIQGYAPPYNWAGAVGNDGAINWLIEGNEVRHNAAAGIRLGPGTRVVGNAVHHNAVMGISAFKAHRGLIERNDVYANAFTADVSAASATRAGLKIVTSDSVVVRGNTVRENGNHGIWFDIGGRGVVAEANTVTGNAGSGIWVEITYGAQVRHNRVERNGGTAAGSWLTRAGIQVSNSPDVAVYGNTVLDNANGITAMQAAGYPADNGYGPLVVQNLAVYDNVVQMRVGATGLAQNVGDPSVFTGRNNRFVRNSYTLGASAGYFAWSDRFQLTETQWKGYGQDPTSSFTR